MTDLATDLIVIGAGPAGANAALAARAAGLDVHLLDEAPKAGGQVWRAPIDGVAEGKTSDAREGASLRARLLASDVACHMDQRVWSVLGGDDGGFQVDSLSANGALTLTAPRLIAATGAYERIVPFTGWTLPGVMGLAAATVMLKSHGVVPGARPVVAGSGPLLLAVAVGMLEAGVKPRAVVDLDSRGDWVARLPALATNVKLAARGLLWASQVISSGVPILYRHGVCEAQVGDVGGEALERVTIAPVDATGAFTGGGERHFACDALLVGHGLTPGAEIPRLLGATMHHDKLRGGYVPSVDDYGRTSVDGLWAVGDGAGVRGAAAACARGQLAGFTAAFDAGLVDRVSFAKQAAQMQRRVERQASFSDAIAGALSIRPGQLASVPGDAIVCRCEDVTRDQIEAAANAGAGDINQLKHFTRTGMGPCQGRMCGEVAAHLLAAKRGVDRADIGTFTQRPPLRPVPLGALTGDFSYDDIPIPQPAPL